MTSNQPYLFRAIYDWIVDNGATPYVLVDATGEHVKVPPQSIQNGQFLTDFSFHRKLGFMVYIIQLLNTAFRYAEGNAFSREILCRGTQGLMVSP